MSETKTWMAYTDAEVRAACEAKSWGYQTRRKSSVREKPVPESPVDDYEWKLIPGPAAKLPEQPQSDFDQGTYYVLTFDLRGGKFILQHDTRHIGILGPEWNMRSYTEIDLVGAFRDYEDRILVTQDRRAQRRGIPHELPRVGWLRRYLMDLTSRFDPNEFSAT